MKRWRVNVDHEEVEGGVESEEVENKDDDDGVVRW